MLNLNQRFKHPVLACHATASAPCPPEWTPSLGNETRSSFPKRWGCRCMTAAARKGRGLSRISPVSSPDLSEEDCSLDGIILTAILPVSRDPSSTNRFLEMVHLTPCSRPSF